MLSSAESKSPKRGIKETAGKMNWSSKAKYVTLTLQKSEGFRAKASRAKL